jgi:hypothetical protein
LSYFKAVWISALKMDQWLVALTVLKGGHEELVESLLNRM